RSSRPEVDRFHDRGIRPTLRGGGQGELAAWRRDPAGRVSVRAEIRGDPRRAALGAGGAVGRRAGAYGGRTDRPPVRGTGRGSLAAVAANGGDRTAHGRRGARLQQPVDGRQRRGREDKTSRPASECKRAPRDDQNCGQTRPEADGSTVVVRAPPDAG